MSRLYVLAVIIALSICFLGQAGATCFGDAPDGFLENGESCDPNMPKFAGRCTSNCVLSPLQVYIAPSLDGWVATAANASTTTLAANVTTGEFNCARFFPAIFNRLNATSAALASTLVCTITGVSAGNVVIRLRFNVASMGEVEFASTIVPALYDTELTVSAAATWTSVFPFWSGPIFYRVYDLTFTVQNGFHDLRGALWFNGAEFGRRAPALGGRTIQWIPDCLLAQQTYFHSGVQYNISTDNIPTFDLLGSIGTGYPVLPRVTWSIRSIIPALTGNASFDAAVASVQAALDTANTAGLNNDFVGNLILSLPWRDLSFAVGAAGVARYPVWSFTAQYDDPLTSRFSLTTGTSSSLRVSFLPSYIAPPVVTTIDILAGSWNFGNARTLSGRGVSVCPGVDTLTQFNAVQNLRWQWDSDDHAFNPTTGLLLDADGTLTTTARASYLPEGFLADRLDLSVTANGLTMASQTARVTYDAFYKVNLRTGGGTHGFAQNWTVSASVQGIENFGATGAAFPGAPFDSWFGVATLVCQHKNYFIQLENLCAGIPFTRTGQQVYTWEVPSNLLFPGLYDVYVTVSYNSFSGGSIIGDSDHVDVTITEDNPPEVSLQITGLRSGRQTPVEPRSELRIINPDFNPDFTYQWKVSYGNARSAPPPGATNGQLLRVPEGFLQQGRNYEVSLTATTPGGVSAVAISHFHTQGLLTQVACSNITVRQPYNKISFSCWGQASRFNAGPLRYQVRGYLTANFTVGTDSWLPLSGFSTLNSWDIYMPYNIKNVIVYVEDQASAYTTIDVPIPALVNASIRGGGQNVAILKEGLQAGDNLRSGDVESIYNIGTAFAAVLNGVARDSNNDFYRRNFIRQIIDPNFVADLDTISIDSALRLLSYLTTRDDFLPSIPQRLLGEIFTWMNNIIAPVVESPDLEIGASVSKTLIEVIDRLSSSTLQKIGDRAPLEAYEQLVQFIISNFFQTQFPLAANNKYPALSGPVGNFIILIDTYTPTRSNNPPLLFGNRDGANVTFTVPASLWTTINDTNPSYPVAVVLTDIGLNYFGYFTGIAPGSVLSNVVSLMFFDSNGLPIEIANTTITVAIVTHNNDTGTNVLPAFANRTLDNWDSNGLAPRGIQIGPIIRDREQFIFTTTHLTNFTVFQGDFIVTPNIGQLAPLANSDPPYHVTAILIIMCSIGGLILIVVLAWLGVRLADQRTYHPITNRSSLIRIREHKDVPTEEDYMSPSQSDSSMVSVHLRRPYYDNGLVIYEDEDSVRSHRSEDEGVDEDEPRSGSDRSPSRSRSASRSPSRSRSPSLSPKSSPRSSVKPSPRD